MSLREKILQEIRSTGPISFSSYMEMCLYDPELGYYSRNAEQFGKAGDFYTSSDVHAVFGRLLARQFDEMWRMMGSPEQIEILELGPGRGLFARDVLDWSEKKFPEFFLALHYSLVERSPALRKKLQLNLDRHFASGKVSLNEGSHLDLVHPCHSDRREESAAFRLAAAAGVPVIVFANEFFDALPIEIVSTEGSLRVAEQSNQLVESWVAPAPEELEFLDRFGVHPESGERIEVPLVAQQYVNEIAGLARTAVLLVIDYGYTRQEQLAGRHRGTLAAYRHHSTSSNPYEAPGEQDLTAHVNFTALAAAAEQQGMLIQPLLTQSQFLLGIGERNQFSDAFEDTRMPQERAKVALQLKHLINPEGMGETFHVLVASRNIERDKVASLSGLSFGRPRKMTQNAFKG